MSDSSTGPTGRNLSFVTMVAAALSITACQAPYDGTRVCANPDGRRLADSNCRNASARGTSGGAWYYLGRGRSAPAEGEHVSGGSFKTPARGGFGGSAHFSGGS